MYFASPIFRPTDHGPRKICPFFLLKNTPLLDSLSRVGSNSTQRAHSAAGRLSLSLSLSLILCVLSPVVNAPVPYTHLSPCAQAADLLPSLALGQFQVDVSHRIIIIIIIKANLFFFSAHSRRLDFDSEKMIHTITYILQTSAGSILLEVASSTFRIERIHGVRADQHPRQWAGG